MYSLEQIKAMNNKASKKAKQTELQPYIARCNGDEQVSTCQRLGNYIPKGWKLVNTYFVDNSGLGSDNEPALSFKQFLGKVRAGYGYGIGEAGQVQIYIHY